MADVPRAPVAQMDGSNFQGLVTLHAAKLHLWSTQDTFSKAQENFQKARELYSAQEDQVTKIQGRLASLSQSVANLADIKVVLEICISLIANMKQTIMSMCQNLNAISATIDALRKYVVPSWLSDIEKGPSAYNIGAYTLNMWQSAVLYQAAITMLANFSISSSIAAMVRTTTASLYQ